MNRILDLVLTFRYNDMIDIGDKREEYREIKPHWVNRIIPCTHECANPLDAVLQEIFQTRDRSMEQVKKVVAI